MAVNKQKMEKALLGVQALSLTFNFVSSMNKKKHRASSGWTQLKFCDRISVYENDR